MTGQIQTLPGKKNIRRVGPQVKMKLRVNMLER
jgi:hypothetical protein